jgi:hypothetical protein
MLCHKNYANKSDVEPRGGTVGDAKIDGKWQIHPPIPLLPQRNEGPLDKHLYIQIKMIAVHSVKQVPPWATEKPVPHFGKPSGLAPGS